MSQRIAIVTGGNRGIGRAIVAGLSKMSGWTVILTARAQAAAEDAAAAFQADGLNVVGLSLDVTDQMSLRRFVRTIADDYGRADVLVNNAGIFVDRNMPPAEVDLAYVRQTMETNYYGPVRLTQMLLPLMEREGYGRVVNVSSRMGSIEQMEGQGNALGYRTSKAAINAATRILAASTKADDIKINAASPGWVRTDMGGPQAMRSPEEGADTIVWLATLPSDGPTGGFFHDRKPMAW